MTRSMESSLQLIAIKDTGAQSYSCKELSSDYQFSSEENLRIRGHLIVFGLIRTRAQNPVTSRPDVSQTELGVNKEVLSCINKQTISLVNSTHI